MLNITPSVVDAFVHDRMGSMIERIARWLSGELPGWNGAPGSPDRHDLEEIVRLGTDFGMEVETDFALLAEMLITAPAVTGRRWRDLVAQPDIAAVLSGTDRNPPSKLLWLDERLKG